LWKPGSTADYFGPDGLGCFIAGHYAQDQDAGGMLGYVQKDSVAAWSARLEAAMIGARALLRLCEGEVPWDFVALTPTLHSRKSCHDRTSIGRNVTIYHTLLAFN
jgi:hypothetical protein